MACADPWDGVQLDVQIGEVFLVERVRKECRKFVYTLEREGFRLQEVRENAFGDIREQDDEDNNRKGYIFTNDVASRGGQKVH